MSKSKLNGWHGIGVGALIALTFLGGVSLLKGENVFSPPAKANPEPAATAVKIGKSGGDRAIERFYDREAGVVCYILAVKTMDCMPEKETNASWRTK